MPLTKPGTPAYRALSLYDQFKAVSDCIASETGSDRNRNLVKAWENERDWLRFRITLGDRERGIPGDPEWDLKNNIWIAAKSGEPTLFDPNRPQKKLLQVIKAAQADKKPAHPFGRPMTLYVPGPRQWGKSALITAIAYIQARNNPNRGCAILAQDDQTTRAVMAKVRYCYEHDYVSSTPEHSLKPECDTTAKLELGFDNGSHVWARTGGLSARSQFHGFTLHDLILDEFARWTNPDKLTVVNGIIPAMPPANMAWTMRTFISSGNGYEEFAEACITLDKRARGEMVDLEDWLPDDAEMFFIPATMKDDAFMPFENEKAKEVFLKSLSEWERLMLTHYGATPEFVQWWRHEEKAMSGYSVAAKRRAMLEAYPLELIHAFQTTGGSVFDQERIGDLMPRVKPPIYRGDVRAAAGQELFDGSTPVSITPRAVLYPSFENTKGEGPLAIFDRPRRRHEYTIGVDVAWGNAKGDFSVIVVFDRNTRKVAARWRDRARPSTLVAPIRLLHEMYNRAKVNIEANFYGASIIESLAETDVRPHLYLRKNPSGVDITDKTQLKAGTNVTSISKPQLIYALQVELEENAGVRDEKGVLLDPDDVGMFTDVELLREMRDYREEETPSGAVKTTAPKGKFDDIIMATCHAIRADKDDRPVDQSGEEKPAPPETIGQQHLRLYQEREEAESQGGHEWWEIPEI